MSKRLTISALLSVFVLSLFSCKNGPYEAPYEHAGGYIIGKETCRADTSKEYWLVDLSISPRPSPYGDTLVYNGTVYLNAVKTTGLAPEFKFEGARVGFDFHLSAMPSLSNCDISNPHTYPLKEMYVLDQAEIR